jgi:O-antigen/teichoic acid export membrane protein
MTVFWWRQASVALGGLSVTWGGTRTKIREVYGYSIWQMANALVAVAANVGDRYFIALRLSAASLGSYTVSLRVQSMGRMLFYSVNQALFPAASAASTEPGRSERLVVTATWHVSFLAGLALGWITICGPAFLKLWVGAQVSEMAGTALRVLVLTLVFEIPSATGSSYLNAHALTKLTALNNVFTTALTLGLMVPLGERYGVAGVALAALAGLVLTRPPLHVWMYRRYFGPHVPAGDYFSAFYGVGLCSLLLSAAFSPMFDWLFSLAEGVLGFLLASAVVGPLYLAAVVALVRWGLADSARLQELCNTAAARNLPIVSPLFARLAR